MDQIGDPWNGSLLLKSQSTLRRHGDFVQETQSRSLKALRTAVEVLEEAKEEACAIGAT